MECFTYETSLCTCIHLHDAASCHSTGASSLHSGSTGDVWRWGQGRTQHFPCCPSSGGSAGCHRRRTLSVPLRQSFATSFSRLQEPHPQRLVRTHKMIVGAPPLQMGQQVWGLLRSGPGTASKGCHSMADGQIDSLNESRVESSREA